MATIIIRNVSGTTLDLEDFGLSMVDQEERELHELFDLLEITSSQQLKDLVSAGDIIVNNGSTDLSAADGVKQLTLITQYEDEADDPSQSGGWAIGSTPPATPNPGDGWYNTVDQMLYTWDSVRLLWLTARHNLYFGLDGNAQNKFLEAPAAHNNPYGHVGMMRDSVITAAHITVERTLANTTAKFFLVKNVMDILGELNIGGAGTGWQQFEFLTAAIKYDAGDSMQMYIASNKAIQQPFITVEMAWRIDP